MCVKIVRPKSRQRKLTKASVRETAKLKTEQAKAQVNVQLSIAHKASSFDFMIFHSRLNVMHNHHLLCYQFHRSMRFVCDSDVSHEIQVASVPNASSP